MHICNNFIFVHLNNCSGVHYFLKLNQWTPNFCQRVYLELVTLSADAAGQARLLDQLLHLLQQRRLCHHLTLLVGLKGKE